MEPTREPRELIVHALKFGSAACGRAGTPMTWQIYETHVKFDSPEVDKVNCDGCRDVLGLETSGNKFMHRVPELTADEGLAGVARLKKKHPDGGLVKATRAGYALSVANLTESQAEILMKLAEAFRKSTATSPARSARRG